MFFVLLCILLPCFAVWFFGGSLDVYKNRRFWCNVSLVCAEGKGGSGGMVEWEVEGGSGGGGDGDAG
jgi:uncharacterized membrane protein YgcG